jgi:hypothetical protein
MTVKIFKSNFADLKKGRHGNKSNIPDLKKGHRGVEIYKARAGYLQRLTHANFHG